MKKSILPLIFALVSVAFCHAQIIETEKVFGGYKFTQNGNKLGIKDLAKTMKSNDAAYELIKKAESSNTIATVVGAVGGFLVGWPVGTALGGGDANWTLAAVGAGLIVVGIPISSSVNKNAKSAVDIYNSTLESSSYFEPKMQFKIIASGNGVGFYMSF